MLPHPEGERPPTTSEFQDIHPVLQPGPLAREVEHLLLGIVQAFCAIGIKTAAVFTMFSKDQAKELRRELVVLLVCCVGQYGNGALTQPGNKGLFLIGTRLDVSPVFNAETLSI